MKKEATPTGTSTGNSASKLGADMIKKGQAVKSTSGLSGQEIKTIQSILDLIVNKAPEGETALALQKALTILTQNTKNIEDKGQSGAPALPKVPPAKPGNPAYKAPAMPGLKEKMSSKEKMAKGLYNEDEMGSSDKYPVGTVLFKPKGNQTITVKRIEGDKIFVVSDLTPNREFQWSTNIIDDGIRTKEFQLKSSGQNEMETMTAEDKIEESVKKRKLKK